LMTIMFEGGWQWLRCSTNGDERGLHVWHGSLMVGHRDPKLALERAQWEVFNISLAPPLSHHVIISPMSIAVQLCWGNPMCVA
jgi:hypothetical protein